MAYELAHGPRTASSAELVTVEAPSSWAAIEQFRRRSSAEQVILYVRPLD